MIERSLANKHDFCELLFQLPLVVVPEFSFTVKDFGALPLRYSQAFTIPPNIPLFCAADGGGALKSRQFLEIVINLIPDITGWAENHLFYIDLMF